MGHHPEIDHDLVRIFQSMVRTGESTGDFASKNSGRSPDPDPWHTIYSSIMSMGISGNLNWRYLPYIRPM